jgi:hypothetical protein
MFSKIQYYRTMIRPLGSMHVRVPKLGNTFGGINALMDYTINKYKNGQLE